MGDLSTTTGGPSVPGQQDREQVPRASVLPATHRTIRRPSGRDPGAPGAAPSPGSPPQATLPSTCPGSGGVGRPAPGHLRPPSQAIRQLPRRVTRSHAPPPPIRSLHARAGCARAMEEPMEPVFTEPRRARRRRLTATIAARRRALHQRLHPGEPPGCPCQEASLWFAERRLGSCDCRRRLRGRPKVGRGCWVGLRPAVRSRIDAGRVVAAVRAGRLDPQDVPSSLRRHGWTLRYG